MYCINSNLSLLEYHSTPKRLEHFVYTYGRARDTNLNPEVSNFNEIIDQAYL